MGMTRFEKEITGMLGEYWERQAQIRVKSCVREAKNEAEVDETGAIRWKHNGQYLMDDYCEVLEYAEYPFSREATRIAREAQNEVFLREYKSSGRSVMVDPELIEEIGKGVEVVNVLTGEKIIL